MRVAFKDHRGMGLRLAAVLEQAGHELVGPCDPAPVALVDHDVPWGVWQAACDSHERVIVYPHGGGLIARGDGQHPAHLHTETMMVAGDGTAELLTACGYPRRLEVIGCTFHDPEPLRIPDRRRMRVLLAPNHDGDPHLVRLLALLGQLNIDLTVRDRATVPYPKPTPHLDIRFGPLTIQGAMTALLEADMVITGSSTFLAAALASGVPAVAYAQGDGNESGQPASHPALWEAAHYPVDATNVRDAHDLLALMACACQEQIVGDWRDRFVGGPLDPARVLALVEG